MKHPDKKMLAEWTRMTDRNEHDEVRISIAKWFQSTDEYLNRKYGYATDYERCFQYIRSLHEVFCYMPDTLQAIRLIVTNSMLNDIGGYLESIRDEIQRCL